MTHFFSKRSGALLMASLPLAMLLSILLPAGQTFAQADQPPAPAGMEWRCVTPGQARAFTVSPGVHIGEPVMSLPNGTLTCELPEYEPQLVPAPPETPSTQQPAQPLTLLQKLLIARQILSGYLTPQQASQIMSSYGASPQEQMQVLYGANAAKACLPGAALSLPGLAACLIRLGVLRP